MTVSTLIIFDLDGTLIQSQIDYLGIREQLKNILKEFLPSEEYTNINKQVYTILDLVEMIKNLDNDNRRFLQAWSIVENEEMKGYENAFVEDDVLPTLKELRKRQYNIAILTNNSKKLTDYALAKYEFQDLVDFVLTRDDVTASKPDPEGLKIIASRFQRDIKDIIFIGDSWVDAETAQNANVTFVYLGFESAPGTRRKQIPSKYTINKISDLLEILE